MPTSTTASRTENHITRAFVLSFAAQEGGGEGGVMADAQGGGIEGARGPLTVAGGALAGPDVLLRVLDRRDGVGELRDLSLKRRDVLCKQAVRDRVGGACALGAAAGLRLNHTPCFAMSWNRSSPVWMEKATSFSDTCGRWRQVASSQGKGARVRATYRAHPVAEAHAVQPRRGRNDGEVALFLPHHRVVGLAIGANHDRVNVKRATRDNLK